MARRIASVVVCCWHLRIHQCMAKAVRASSVASFGQHLTQNRSKATELPPGRDCLGSPAVAQKMNVVPSKVVDSHAELRARQTICKPDRTLSVPRLAGVAQRLMKRTVCAAMLTTKRKSRGRVGLWPPPRRGLAVQPIGWLPG